MLIKHFILWAASRRWERFRICSDFLIHPVILIGLHSKRYFMRNLKFWIEKWIFIWQRPATSLPCFEIAWKNRLDCTAQQKKFWVCSIAWRLQQTANFRHFELFAIKTKLWTVKCFTNTIYIQKRPKTPHGDALHAGRKCFAWLQNLGRCGLTKCFSAAPTSFDKSYGSNISRLMILISLEKKCLRLAVKA